MIRDTTNRQPLRQQQTIVTVIGDFMISVFINAFAFLKNITYCLIFNTMINRFSLDYKNSENGD